MHQNSSLLLGLCRLLAKIAIIYLEHLQKRLSLSSKSELEAQFPSTSSLQFVSSFLQ
jgi:hypothetical protein